MMMKWKHLKEDLEVSNALGGFGNIPPRSEC